MQPGEYFSIFDLPESNLPVSEVKSFNENTTLKFSKLSKPCCVCGLYTNKYVKMPVRYGQAENVARSNRRIYFDQPDYLMQKYSPRIFINGKLLNIHRHCLALRSALSSKEYVSLIRLPPVFSRQTKFSKSQSLGSSWNQGEFVTQVDPCPTCRKMIGWNLPFRSCLDCVVEMIPRLKEITFIDILEILELPILDNEFFSSIQHRMQKNRLLRKLALKARWSHNGYLRIGFIPINPSCSHLIEKSEAASAVRSAKFSEALSEVTIPVQAQIIQSYLD